ncbi:nucleoside-diphosphate kinase [Monocercomonoides exilis]|uniref:nucleoside-diphosphate kinase n=1 Tax=Monocercomonoides exilis TaxID=2049356 RepID=UPI0035594A24|nr:nucleoside-diphosphate kinase [Monocercomonoides exilis]|eukprot:MONOS_6862.1-p1 / transcript=MONOS_6862.1 / gene=MONOS_6862 / organism=Monocercomonoides_exilis_PA203 / gene_product=nucleoside-diphosphate kinase [EC:2.7.4.6] / transcript_product=nucleoside-diphosphate kinase [EC:2.7.4.6] / location=Mono_scaffold00224:76031-76510(-) / protein_length=143 / sequence_SO=supercontig / SO=protein_coding / is_pseudo=false
MATPEVTMTLALIKPDAYPKRAEIIEEIKANGFTIVKMREEKCTPDLLKVFYKEHEEKHFFNDLVNFMASGPIVILALSKVNAVPEWRKLIGPTNSLVAKEKNPETLRAKYGTDGQCNACHGSANDDDAKRELGIFFPELSA